MSKKITLIVLVLVLLGLFTGCSSSNDDIAQDNQEVVSDDQVVVSDANAEDLDASINDEFIDDNVEIGDLI